VTSAGLVAYLRAIAARSPLPIIPYLKAVPDDDALRRMADMPSVVAVKWGVNDLPAFGRAVALSRGRSDVRWICGTAELWAPFFWAVGAVGFTSGLVNVTTSLSPSLLDALEAGDRTRTMELWATIAPFERLRSRSSDGYNVAVVKAAMRLLGNPAGPVRPPSSDVDEADETAIAGLLATWDLTRPAVAAR
jgi:4-hydroxy-tetrahydrodipicolinate synthase